MSTFAAPALDAAARAAGATNINPAADREPTVEVNPGTLIMHRRSLRILPSHPAPLRTV
jgi:hypothetical protein